MKFIDPSVQVISKLNGKAILKHLELCGKICYKSEDGITEDSCSVFVGKIIDSEHESVVEHVSITVKFICSRACSHQIVRHRIASYSQESQRYVNYSRGKFGSQVTYIKPINFDKWSEEIKFKYKLGLENAEKVYMDLIASGLKAQDARGQLPNDTKTEIMVTMNLRAWRHFLRMRTDPHAQAEIRFLAEELLKQFKSKISIIFDDIGE